ncbi:CDP-diacylglycerol--glycerol-3-phosphate 3-phosphatidyltransferase [Evansella caseinilytica]|uniref:Phosphatidylglycerophosphate synthase n=1 Tax=Evansella caseinilytica TaxID=1503961 RepID=A0A1H3RTI1_9BACI|nr:CDP-alcohol phosphatidyltransferase family protein [Evansella caseinilytica]SDZ29017.1 CDP-diacylglycerol--glycerol-3-phosphate 3-phosphatidyltransferase [Evansella caseinilytica]
MKYIANSLSISRIALSLSMLCFYRNEFLFLFLYLACGVSDFLDGYIARKTNTQSAIGAKLDSFADLVMFGTIIILLLLMAGEKLTVFFPWLLAILTIRSINIIIAAWKYHSFVILHTYGNKIIGLFTFMLPILFVITEDTTIFWPVIILAILFSLEESLIHLTAATLHVNRKSIFFSK